MSASPSPSGTAYHQWRTRSVTVQGTTLTVAAKPGLIGQGRDAAADMLAEELVVESGSTVLCFQCGNGLVGVVAAMRGAARVGLSDRNVVAAQASERTLALNGVSVAVVRNGQGADGFDDSWRADLVTIRIPTEKQAVTQLLLEAFTRLRIGGRCCIAGATDEGIKSAATLLQEVFGNGTVLATRGGCRAVMGVKRTPLPAGAAHRAADPSAIHPIDVILRGHPTRLFSRPGVFSWEHLDEAADLLAAHMQIRPGNTVLDLGCGSGPLGLTAARLSAGGQVTLVDVDIEAVRCAAHAVEHAGLANCEVLASDVAAAVRDRRFDVVVTNPPFHVGKGTDLDVPAQFIRDAYEVLSLGGSLQLVANRTLPYERLMQECFGRVTTLHDGARFKILGARR